MSVTAVVDGRDDSGNSSSSSSSVTSLEKLSTCETAVSVSSTSPVDGSLWLPDYNLSHCGYELADSSHVLLPLHRTVCCALCRSVVGRVDVMTESVGYMLILIFRAH